MEEEKKEVQPEVEIPFLRKEEVPAAEPKKKKKKRIPVPAWIVFACGFLLLTGIGGFHIYETVHGQDLTLLTTEISPTDYGGYDGEGTVDEENFHPEEEAMQQLEEEIASRAERSRNTDDLQRLYDSIDCGFDRTEGLHNGDKIVYACTFDADAAEQANYNLQDLVLTFTVSGLKEYQMLDPFTNVSASWTLGNDYAAVIDLYIPDELQEYGITYSYHYGGNEYNGHSIFITAEADEEALKEAGYMLSSTEMEYELGPRPQRITDADELSEAEKTAIRDDLRAMLEAELEACGWQAEITRSTVRINGIGDSYISRNTAYFSDRTNGFTVIFELDTDSSGWFNLNSYDARFIGQIYRMSDGSVQFLTRTSHACRFTGSFGNFTLEGASN